MAKESEIVNIINDSLKLQFISKRFQKGSIDPIAELIRTSVGEIKPSIVDNFGECRTVTIDDTKPFQIYHRMTGALFEQAEEFGNLDFVNQRVNMLMIVIGDKTRLQLNKEDIMAGIAAGFPLFLTKDQLNTLNLMSCDLVPGEFNLDREAVWSNEYNTDFKLKPAYFMFSFAYSILTKFRQSCFIICE